MPPLRTASLSTVGKNTKTERTHEENQERAYIAASRRSDRSLEARVESARRASEIHKKRTGRSLRVTEEDVSNEEMYEEEDDDLPMQYRRINALYPGQAFGPFGDRVNTYLAGQTGMRNVLHQAIFQANQNTMHNRNLNNFLLNNASNGFPMNNSQNTPQPLWSPNQMMQSSPTQSDAQHSSGQQQVQSPNAYTIPDTGRMSLSLPSPGSRRPSSNASASQLTQRPNSSHQHQQHQSRPSFDNSDPLSSTLPVNQQQLLDGHSSLANGVHASQMTSGFPMPSMPSTYQYQFDPYAKANNTPGSEQFAFGQRDLSQTLTPQNMPNLHYDQTPPTTNTSADLDFGADMMENSWLDNDMFDLNDPSYGSGRFSHGGHGQITPGEAEWNPDDFFEFNTASN